MAPVGARRALGRYLRMYLAPPRYRRGERLTLTTTDGVRLNAWRLPGPDDARCTVVVVHGFVNSSRSPAVHAFATRLAAHVHVVVPDMRGHGRSGGRCSMGRHEPLDVAAAVAAARPDLPVVTLGTSLGGAAVLLHAGTAGGVAGVVAVSAPAHGELDGIGTHRVRRWVSGRAARALMAVVLRTRVGPDCIYLPEAGQVVARIAPAFTLVVHDPDDWYFGPDHAEAVHRWAAEPKDIWWYHGAGHGTDLLTPAFADRLVAELDRRLSGAPADPPATP